MIQQANGNNLQELLRNLDSDSSSSGTADEESSETKIIINRFVLEGASASLTAPDLDEVREITLPTITLRNIGTAEGGATGREIAQQVLEPVIQEAIQEAAVQVLKDKASGALEGAADAVLKGIFGSDDEPEQ